MSALAATHDRLPHDLLNYHYDPVTCAVAHRCPGAIAGELRLRPVIEGSMLRWPPDERGRPTRVVVEVDGERFGETWISCVEAAQRR